MKNKEAPKKTPLKNKELEKAAGGAKFRPQKPYGDVSAKGKKFGAPKIT